MKVGDWVRYHDSHGVQLFTQVMQMRDPKDWHHSDAICGLHGEVIERDKILEVRPASEKEANFNKLSAPEDERLAILSEECGEVIQAIGKIQRHGYENHNPTNASVSPSNREALETELGHIQAVVDRMMANGDISGIAIKGSRNQKAASVKKWLHHQND